MAADPTSRVLSFRSPNAADDASRDTTAGDGTAPRPTLVQDGPDAAALTRLATKIPRRLAFAMPAINLAAAAVTYVFVDHVVPLPRGAQPSPGGTGVVVSIIVAAALGWTTCQGWAMLTFRPIKHWLERGGEPTDDERARTVRFALHEARQCLVVWCLVALGFCVLDLALGGSVAAGVLVAVIVMMGGAVATAICYQAAEAIMRPAVALALRVDPPAHPLLPGVGARIYLAWEFGTAVAVGGAVVTAVAYLVGADISPRRMAGTVIFLGGLALLVGLLTILAAIRSVARPLRSLRRAMRQVEKGDTEPEIPIDDGGEIGLLQAGFNRMVAGLRERDRVRELFGRHVGEEVAKSALRRGDELGGEVRDAAVLFVDVIGSTGFAASHDPREVVATLNRFFGIVVEVVTLHGGWVNKFEGDAALCAFGAPTDHPDAAGAALAAARELRGRLLRELDGLDAAIGLSAGPVVAGNIGAAQRYEYTVVGDPVNEAARLTELAKLRSCRLLASEAILQRASANESGRWKLDEEVMLRGRSEVTQVAAPV